MPPRKPTEESAGGRRILGRVAPEEFVGRAGELDEIVSHSVRRRETLGLLLLLAPPAGVSELLRQAYDRLFNERKEVIPVYFPLSHSDRTAASIGQQVLQTFLQQRIAFRRDEPSLAEA